MKDTVKRTGIDKETGEITIEDFFFKKKTGRPKKELPNIDDKRKISDDTIAQLLESGNFSEDQVKLINDTLQNSLDKYDVKKDEKEIDSVTETNMQVLEEFLESKRIESKSQCTIYNYGNEIAKMFKVLNKRYDEITSADIRRYMEYRKQNDGLSTSTVANIRMYLMSFYKFLMIEEKITKNPMDKIGVVKTEQKVVETLSDEEAEMIRCACTNERDIAIIDLLSGSGMRVSELTGLNIADVDFENDEIKVFGKGSKERICFLTGKAKVHLKWYLEQRTDDNPALFVTAKKPYTRLSKNGVEYVLKSIAKKSNISRTRLYPHLYRKTLATNMINKGASADKVQQILGHQDVSTTIKCYVNYSKDTVKQAHHQYVS